MAVLRYVELIVVSYFTIVTDMSEIRIYLYLLLGLFAFEFMATLKEPDLLFSIFTVLITILPAFLFLVIIQLTNNGVMINFNETLLCIFFDIYVAWALLKTNHSIQHNMEKKYLAQCRYNEDAQASYQQLIENQEKLKKANEQLGHRKLQLEVANQKIKNINKEILFQNQLLKIISEYKESDALIARIVDMIYSKLQVDVIGLFFYPNSIVGQGLIWEVKSSYSERFQERIYHLLTERKETMMNEQSVDVLVDNHVDKNIFDCTNGETVGSMMILPLKSKGEIIGQMFLAAAQYDAFLDAISFYETVASTILLGIENVNLYLKMEESAIRDELTGIYNRRYLKKVLERYIDEANAQRLDLSVVMFDIDKFKDINDTYGHLFGDHALKMVAKIAEEVAMSNKGILGRYGGEEFVIVFPNKGLDDTYELIEKMYQQVKNNSLLHKQKKVKITLSIGIATYPESCDDPMELLMRADCAMYYAKQTGRDRIVKDGKKVREKVLMK